MSDSSGDELATYDPTTPARPAPAKKPAARPGAGSKSAAGPSSRPATAASKNAPKRTNGAAKGKPPEQIIIDSSSEDEPRLAGAVEGNEVVAVAPAKVAPKRGPGRASDTSATNKAKPSLAKGKARADGPPPSKPSRSATREDDAMEVDGIRSPDENGEEPSRKRLKYERDQYSKQLEEALQIRRTEPEQALQEHMAVYENLLKNQQTWQDLSNAASTSAKSQIPHFLSRAAADAEKETTEKEVRRLKDVIKQKDTEVADKDRKIAELERDVKEMRFELNQEIERGKTLAARPQGASLVRSAVKPDGDPRNAAVIKLYEDMSNLLVISAKVEKSQYLGLDENVFICVYTHTQGEANSDEENASLSFNLRELYERPEGSDPSQPVQSKKELVRKCKYTPLNVDDKDPEFFQRLEFFKEPFLFAWDQLTVFLKTLTDRMAAAVNPEDEEGEDDELEDEEGGAVEREVIHID
ncbi:hypothetical protein EVJ58_g7289 [Rhodofomes roseus]|uniref:Monopolin complex subunit Csm1/Pcs1 C-terminal domain-containing protein n=1 Tax=Rhodofomes roseus TaxID=34475 RepID=A0A4Y9Y482_9APHY|nr:hypothetical protein EVJ58_g7289 [Rhodofomes roseus]